MYMSYIHVWYKTKWPGIIVSKTVNCSSCKLIHSQCKYLFMPLKRYLFYFCVCTRTYMSMYERAGAHGSKKWTSHTGHTLYNTAYLSTHQVTKMRIICFLTSTTAIHDIYTDFLSWHSCFQGHILSGVHNNQHLPPGVQQLPLLSTLWRVSQT